MIVLRIFLFAATAFLFSENGFAQLSRKSSPLERFSINAKNMERDFDRGVVFLNGDVRVSFNDKKLRSDRAEIWYKNKIIFASGNATIESAGFEISGARIEYNYESNLGTIFEGSVKSGKVIFEGKQIEKVGENDFKAKEGRYTACDCTPRMWSFSGSDIDAEMGGYAKLKWPVLRIMNVPVFGLPYIIVPLKSDRQSGLLLPEHEYTRDGGTAISESYFWAMAENKDSTLSLKNYDRRGLKTLGNFRYRASENSYAEANGAYLNDKVFPTSTRLNRDDQNLDFDRWFFKYKHFYDLPEGYTDRADFTLLSDLQYLSDFSKEIEEPGNPALENRVSLTKTSEEYFASVETAFYTNLLKTNPKADNDDAVHRLPEIRYSLIQRPLGESGLMFKLDAHYTNFARNWYAYDDVRTTGIQDSRDNVYQPYPVATGDTHHDLIRTGQRFDIQPSISYVFFPARIFEITPSLTYRHTNYQFGVYSEESKQQVSRQYLQGLISARTKLSRVYQPGKTRYKHEISPEITWSNIPYIEEPTSHPFFRGSHALPNFKRYQPLSDDDVFQDTGVQFDYFDRVLDKNLITFGVGSKLIRKEFSPTNDPQYSQVGTFKIFQTYDLVEAAKREKEVNVRPWSEVTTLLDLRFRAFETNSLVQFFPYHNVYNISSRVRFNALTGHYLQFIYNRRFDIPDTGEIDYEKRTKTLHTAIGLVSSYIDISGGAEYSLVNKVVNSWNAQLSLKPPGNCVVFIFQLEQPAGREPIFNSKINFSFDGG